MIAVDVTNVLLCGTGYGQVYLPAIYEDTSLELAGILARGSSRSRRLAQQAGVELYHEIDEVNDPIDLACVAVGGTMGFELALDLLKKKVPVLIEHPIGKQDCEQLLAVARENGTHCHINGHFADLPPAQDFIQSAQKLNEAYRPMMISGAANPRTLYSWLDLLMRSFGAHELTDLKIIPLGSTGDHTVCTFLLNEVPVNLSLQNWSGERDDSRDAPLGHQLSVTYPVGNLLLTGTYGGCVWSPLVAAVPDRSIPASFCSPTAGRSLIAEIAGWRVKANQMAINQLMQQVNGTDSAVAHQSPVYIKKLTTGWSGIMERMSTKTRNEIPEVVPERYWNVFEGRGSGESY